MAIEKSFVEECVIPASFVRGFLGGREMRFQSSCDYVSKRYKPTNNLEPPLGELIISFILTPGTARELYKPTFRVRFTWSDEYAYHGASYLLNEDTLVDELNWFDHSGGIKHTINHFQADTQNLLVALGHFLESAQLIVEALSHPRLFTSLMTTEAGKDPGDPERQFVIALGSHTKLNSKPRNTWDS